MSRREVLPMLPVVVGLVVGGLLFGGVVIGGRVSPSFGASEDDSGVELLERAKEAASGYDFTGEVVVEWRADGALRRERVPVHEAAGVLRVGGAQQLMGVGEVRLIESGGDWKRIWAKVPSAAEAHRAEVQADRKYTLTVRDGPEVAGRDTTVVEAHRGGRVCERFAVDDATGILLRREQIGRRGRVERAVGFIELSDPRSSAAAPKPTAPKSDGAEPRSLAGLPPGFAAPARLGAGFLLTGRYRSADGSVHLFYTDGVYSASVFERSGELDPADLPDGATTADFAGGRARRYETASGTVAVWTDGERVYTLVSDAPKRDLDAIIEDLPRPESGDTSDRLTEFVLAPFRW